MVIQRHQTFHRQQRQRRQVAIMEIQINQYHDQCKRWLFIEFYGA